MNWKALFTWEAPQKGEFDLHPKWPVWAVWAMWNVIRNPWFSQVIPRLNTPIKVYILPSKSLWLKPANFNPAEGLLRLLLVDVDGRTGHFTSYRRSKIGPVRGIEWYWGYKPNGAFGAALRLANAKPITGPHVG